jgi:hypothetical protein
MGADGQELDLRPTVPGERATDREALIHKKALAAQTAGSPHGPWRVANSPALSLALPLAYFDSLGLPRLFDALA